MCGWTTAGRRRVDDRQVSHAGHGHLQRPRNRRRGERQDVDLRAQLLEALLVLDAEPLFLVDDHQAEIAELHIFLQQAMGADDDVDEPAAMSFRIALASFGD